MRWASVKDLTNKRYGHLVAMWPVGSKAKHLYWAAACDCGNYAVVRGNTLSLGTKTNCGCLNKKERRARKHGHARTHRASPTYRSWFCMKQRCYNPAADNYGAYGGKGITVCDRWKESFENFLEDMGFRPPRKTLDRFPNCKGNYEPSNCRWATAKEQAQNRDCNPQAKIARQNVGHILELRRTGKTQKQIATMYGVAQAFIGTLEKENKACPSIPTALYS